MPNSDFITDNPEIAYEWLKQGKILAYPTESVWGLGCNAFDEKAVQTLLNLKNRPAEKGLIVLTSNELLVRNFWVNLPTDRQQQIFASWEQADDKRQATTWLLEIPERTYIPRSVRGEHTSLAIRVIRQEQVATLCDLMSINEYQNPFGFLVSTSCNVGGESPASDFATAYRYFGDKACYLMGDTLGYDKPSQIKSAVTGELIRM